ncbi:hypothetical protein [Bartonella tamiae]|uniref:Uncharacterized protein n=1 Tax=Bartonella tamiae Th239 TaxID=1094558 RepID=J1JVN9_9HYPH|nr:hypothetical protein [Bartonella tamiae]EJF89027.1 hypothetical protein ME5_01578 [Bartonella tamiae Th239]EJF94723.1 hypothetical protein MEG_00304 [Bartonella tamiae Th307]
MSVETWIDKKKECRGYNTATLFQLKGCLPTARKKEMVGAPDR